MLWFQVDLGFFEIDHEATEVLRASLADIAATDPWLLKDDADIHSGMFCEHCGIDAELASRIGHTHCLWATASALSSAQAAA